MTDKQKKLIEAMKIGVKNRYHYDVLRNSLVEVDSIFFDKNHYQHGLFGTINTIFIEYLDTLSYGNYNEYFRKYILDDLYFLGFVNSNEYNILRISNNIKLDLTFHNIIKEFTLKYGDKYEKRNAGNIWTNHLEIALCTNTVSKYFKLQNAVKTEEEIKNEKPEYIYNPNTYSVEIHRNGKIVENVPFKVFIDLQKSINNKDKDAYESGECLDGASNNSIHDTIINKPKGELYPGEFDDLNEISSDTEEKDNTPTMLDSECCIDKNNIPWDSYFMGIASLARLRSKDPVCKVGACIVKNKKVLSTGYNGFPSGLNDNDYPWTKGSIDPTENKYFYVVHAELNAILNSDTPVEGSTLYVTKFPCNECTKAIIQAGITKVIYCDKDSDKELFNVDDHNKFGVNLASKRMLEDAGIIIERYKNINNSVYIEL